MPRKPEINSMLDKIKTPGLEGKERVDLIHKLESLVDIEVPEKKLLITNQMKVAISNKLSITGYVSKRKDGKKQYQLKIEDPNFSDTYLYFWEVSGE